MQTKFFKFLDDYSIFGVQVFPDFYINSQKAIVASTAK